MNDTPRGLVPAMFEWWMLLSGNIVSIRRIESVDGGTEAVVRYVDENGAMANGEFNLALSYVSRGKRVSHG